MDLKVVGDRIKLCRKANNLTQPELAEKLGMTRENISGYENGRITPTSTSIFFLSKLFNVSSDFLLGLKDTKE